MRIWKMHRDIGLSSELFKGRFDCPFIQHACHGGVVTAMIPPKCEMSDV